MPHTVRDGVVDKIILNIIHLSGLAKVSRRVVGAVPIIVADHHTLLQITYKRGVHLPVNEPPGV